MTAEQQIQLATKAGLKMKPLECIFNALIPVIPGYAFYSSSGQN